MTKKLVIPTILVATILVAGMFAMMPVQKVTTVHTTIQASTTGLKTVTSTPAAFAIDAASTLTVTAASLPAGTAATLRQITCNYDDGTTAAATDINTITALGEALGAATGHPDIIADAIIPDGGATLGGLDIAFTTTLVVTADATDADANNAIDCTLVIEAPGATTFTAAWT